MNKRLLILGCADRKRDSAGLVPALDRYDGPAYRVVRRFLREHQWPADLSIAVLSAQYGLFGILKRIANYDKRMDRVIASESAQECSERLLRWSASHGSVYISLGKDYMPAVEPGLQQIGLEPQIFDGGIGTKLNKIKSFLASNSPRRRIRADVEPGSGRYRYFLPDWDDLLDPKFDFEHDRFSGANRAKRKDQHCGVLMRPDRLSDGILLSLAQQGRQKGPLRRLEATDADALAPPPLRSHFGLSHDQLLFGDCGAFSYVNEDHPTISVDQAVAMYESYGFDFGASVDHIPAKVIARNGRRVELSEEEKQGRIRTTRDNARQFIDSARRRKVAFNPVGAIQGLTPEDYADAVREYNEYGYRHLAVGGLVPRRDVQIRDIVDAVMRTADDLAERPWVHLFGVFRPNLQEHFRELRVDSFDSASYFRKAWLRSDQNYLGVDGRWYAALRVPMTSDGRTRSRLVKVGADIDRLEAQEQEVLRLLSLYDRGDVALNEILEAVTDYDRHLARSSEIASLREKYRRTLEEKPWRACKCRFCASLGIHMLVFRGANRNKRRGAHNTLMLYGTIRDTSSSKRVVGCR